MQQGIHLDSTLAMHIDSGLVEARNEVDTLESIHALPSYIVTQFVVKTEAAWSNAWREGEILTGEPYIDSIGMEYGLLATDGGDVLNWFLLFFASQRAVFLPSGVAHCLMARSVICECEKDAFGQIKSPGLNFS